MRTLQKDTLEALLLFAALFLPSYLLQNRPFDARILADATYNLFYLANIVPQIALFVFVIFRTGGNAGLSAFSSKDLLNIVTTLLVMLAIATPAIVSSSRSQQFDAIVPQLIPLVALTSVATGYREELFFRSLLYPRLCKEGYRRIIAGAVSVALFAAGHLYQGALALLLAAAIGAFLTWHFDRYQKTHVIAIAHGLYNFAILILLGRFS